jgi:uncharacterized membrane protein (UPF0127 family)
MPSGADICHFWRKAGGGALIGEAYRLVRFPRRSMCALPRSFTLVVAVLFCMAGGLLPSVVVAHAEEAGTEPLTIVTASGQHQFSVEVMRTAAERERGLMFRRFLPQDRGMLFDFKVVRPVMMWMKNTYISLDMIFIGKTGRVVSIETDTEPLSEHIITSGAPVLAVLEVDAGTAARIGLKIGDNVRFPLFAH